MREVTTILIQLLLIALTTGSIWANNQDATEEAAKRPHIIFILADDLGWNDVGFHGSNLIQTPNIDALAYNGIILQNYYVQPICSPSRGALLTGYHPIHTGLQSNCLVASAPFALPTKFKLMPEYLNDLGYKSVMVGKWHQGFHRAVYTPTKRGFSSHVGYWTAHEDYYDHTAQEFIPPVKGWGYDFRRNMSVSREDFGTYATDIFSKEAVDIIRTHQKNTPLFLYLSQLAVHSGNMYAPLQAPKEIVDKFSYIKDEKRRKFAAMLYKLDESVGKVVQALSEADMLKDSVIVFSTDNGGAAGGFEQSASSNFPLKGVKDTLWEGGTRGAGFVWSPRLKSAPRVSTQMMTIQDWLPTLFSAAGGKATALPEFDGMDMWEALSHGEESPRQMFLYNIDDSRRIEGLRVGDWKLVKGSTYIGIWDQNFGPEERGGQYNLTSLRGSPVARTLSKIGRPLDGDRTLMTFRSESTVDCPKVAPSDAAEKCHSSSGSYCLFHVTADPCEMNNVASKYPEVVEKLKEVMEAYRKSAVPRLNKPANPRSDPSLHDYTWTNWLDFYEPLEENVGTPPEEEQILSFKNDGVLQINDLTLQKSLLLDKHVFGSTSKKL